MRVLKRDYVRTLLACSCVGLLLGVSVDGQNSNSSSTKSRHRPTRRQTVQKKKPVELDLSGIDPVVLKEIREWQPAGSTRDLYYSYGLRTIRRLPGNVVRVWIKASLKDDSTQGKSDFLKNRRTQGLRTYGYESFARTLELHEYDCTKGEVRVLSQIDYDEIGNVLDSTTYRKPSWDYIVPDSVGASLSKAVCKRE